MPMNPKSPSPRNLPKRSRKQALQRRFQRALRELYERSGWTAKEFSEKCQLPHRTVLNWLAGTASPGPRRLKELCRTFGWPEDMFASEALEGELFEYQYLDYEKLTQRFLRLQPQDPVEAWGHVPLAGALVFVDLSAAGFECRAIMSHAFGTRIEFSASKSVVLEVQVISGRGLVVEWLDEQGRVRETFDLSEANLKVIKNHLRALAN